LIHQLLLIPFAFFAALVFALFVPFHRDPLFFMGNAFFFPGFTGKIHAPGFFPEIQFYGGQVQWNHLAQLVYQIPLL